MSISAQHPIKRWRLILFAILAALIALLFTALFGGVPSLLSPWVLMAPSSSTYHAEIHRWHDSTWGALTAILLAGSLLTLLWGSQKRPLVAQFFVVGMLFFLLGPIIFGQFDPMLLIISLLIIALFIATYPVPRELLSFSRQGAWNIGLLALSAVALVVISPDTWHNVNLQLADNTSEHAKSGHWYLSATLYILLLLAGLLASIKRAGWAELGMMTGIAFLYLGVAAISIPFHPGSWGTIGGVLALLAGIAYIAITIFEARRTLQPAPTNIPGSVVQSNLLDIHASVHNRTQPH